MDVRFFLLPIVAMFLGGLTSCSITQKPGAGLEAYEAYDRPAAHPQNPDKVHVKVSIRRQRAYVMEDSNVLMSMPVSIGTPSTPTPRGNFRIINKIEKKRSKNGSPMPYWCGITPNYGFHTGWLKHYPCTDGCIRLHQNLAPKFYHLVKVGTPVNIAYSQAEDATHGRIPLPPDSGPLPDYAANIYKGDAYFHLHRKTQFISSN